MPQLTCPRLPLAFPSRDRASDNIILEAETAPTAQCRPPTVPPPKHADTAPWPLASESAHAEKSSRGAPPQQRKAPARKPSAPIYYTKPSTVPLPKAETKDISAPKPTAPIPDPNTTTAIYPSWEKRESRWQQRPPHQGWILVQSKCRSGEPHLRQ